MKVWPFVCLVTCCLASLHGATADRDDILIEDFEGQDYGAWKVEGDAFGKGPARGTLPNQMPVSGFLGKGLVNSYLGGDDAIGTLTSPPVKIDRKYVNFLIGGGGYAGETCMNLRVDGMVVRTATGPNTQPGGSEALDWAAWDVSAFQGKQAVLQIVDQRKGGWGHVNVDHIVQSDRPRGVSLQHRELVISKRYLTLPVKTGATKRQMKCIVDGKIVDEFEIELAEEEPSFWAILDLGKFQGKTVRLEGRVPENSLGMAGATIDNELKGEPIYQEKRRPQCHFTSRRGWLNDPNGLVFSAGEYHLFYQLNPYGWDWGNMHWGHAISKDLVHWEEQPIALYPYRFGDWCFSGSAVVDQANTSGFQSGTEPPLVLAYTSTGRGECIAYSNDRGRTWQEYDGNPVVKHPGRDPRLLWHEQGRRWVMAVYDEADGKRWIAFHTSPDLKHWTYRSRIESYFECPDLYELTTPSGEHKWVLSAADGKYALGEFDGERFMPDGPKQQVWFGNFYAAQTFSNLPGRRVQIGWGQGITFPGAPFNQQMTVPCDLSLRKTADGMRLVVYPVKELECLRGKKHALGKQTLRPNESAKLDVGSDLLDVETEFAIGDAKSVEIQLLGISVRYDASRQLLTCQKVQAPLKPVDGMVKLRILVDRGSCEVFGNDGMVAMSVAAMPDAAQLSNSIRSEGGSATLEKLATYEMRSAWR